MYATCIIWLAFLVVFITNSSNIALKVREIQDVERKVGDAFRVAESPRCNNLDEACVVTVKMVKTLCARTRGEPRGELYPGHQITGGRRKVPTKPQVLSSIQYIICSQKTNFEHGNTSANHPKTSIFKQW